MVKELTVRDEIMINASPSRVWEILVLPKYVAQWDELPENYPQQEMQLGSKVVWELPNNQQSITTIIEANKPHSLVISLHVTTWENTPREGDVAYRYQLVEQGEGTFMKIEIGDFSLLKDGQMYHDASVDFAERAKMEIKDLAEKQI